MPKLPKQLLIGLLILLFVALIGALLINTTNNNSIDKNTAFVINGQKISKDFFNHRVEIQTNFYKNVSPDETKLKTVKKDEADDIINTVLMDQELKSKKLLTTMEEIDQETNTQKAHYETSSSKKLSYEDLLKFQYKMTLEDKKYLVKRDLMKDKINSLRVEKHMWAIWFKRAGPSDSPESSTTEQKAQDAVSLEKAKNILQKVRSGGDLKSLAEQYSEDPISKAKNGDIGFYPAKTVSKDALLQASFASMAVIEKAYGKLSRDSSDLFEYPSGYAVVKVLDVKGDWPYSDLKDFLAKSKKGATIATLVDL